jgi:hypothetical protein
MLALLAVVGILLTPGPVAAGSPAVLGTAPPPRQSSIQTAHVPVPSPPGRPVPGTRPAVSPSRWTSLPGVGSGPTTKGELAGTLVYDPAASEYVYFGGCASACPTNITWTFSNDTWRNVTGDSLAPPARYYADMAYDANAGGVVLFGGVNAAGADLNDTWLYRGGAWSRVNTTGPSPRGSGVLAFDPEPDVNGTVLFGGCDITASLVCTNDTWTWRPSTGWSRLLAASGPSPRAFAYGAYDPAAGAIVLFGGLGPCPAIDCDYSDTWEFADGSWSVLPTGETDPGARYAGGFAYDPSGAEMVLYGGYNLSADSTDSDTWIFAGSGWAALPGSVSPGERGDPSMATGGYGAPPLLYGGGEDDAPTMPTSTWTFDAALVAQITGVGPEVDTNVPAEFNVTVQGGAAPYSVAISWGAGPIDETGNSTSWSFVERFPVGPVNISVAAEDEFHLQTNATLELTAVPGPSVSIEAPVRVTDVGDPLDFLASVASPGVAPTTLAWTFGDGGGSAVGPYVNHSYGTAGNYTVQVSLTDALGAVDAANLSVVVNPDPSATIALSGTPGVGVMLNFSGQVQGGLPPFTYIWQFGDGGLSGSPNATHAFAAPGNYTIQFWANDSLGNSAHAAILVSVPRTNATTPPTEPKGASGPSPELSWTWVLLGVSVVVALTILGLVLYRRGGRRPPSGRIVAGPRLPPGSPPR